MRRFHLAALWSGVLVALLLGIPQAKAESHLIVSPDGPYTSIAAALDAARNGDTIEVRGGFYSGTVVVEKAVTLEGVGWPILDGGDQGTVVTLAAAGSTLRGFEVRGSGTEPDQDHAGITLAAPHTTAENNRLSDVLFGIFVAQADYAIVRGNEITSKQEYETGRKGDAIRLWYSQHVLVEHNHVVDARDVVVWYSSDIILRDNVIERGRYGVHLMYCDNAIIERNQILDNSVGVYVMYSQGATLRENLITGQRGPSGYGLAFKDADNISVVDNVLADNRAGLFLDGTPFTPQGFATYSGNIIAFNDIGVSLQPAIKRSLFENNTLWENVEQVSVPGGGSSIDANTWQGNTWSDYTGFDADGDGLGDMPYHSDHLFESLYDREDRLRALMYSPAVQVIEFAASAFPIVRPKPKLIDTSPRTAPAPLPDFATTPQNPAPMFIAALAVLMVGISCGALSLIAGRLTTHSGRKINGFIPMAQHNTTQPRLTVAGVSKRYGKTQAITGISLTACDGEAIALWGANGAGKSTLIKAILGLIDFEGEIEIGGRSVRRSGKQARAMIGYVPQDALFYDWTVKETMVFYARLKNADRARIPALLERLGLADHIGKRVPVLSGGLKQRLALAVALLSDPPVLLLDEPTANLDAKARRDYLVLLAGLRGEGKLIVFASHRFEELDALADRVLVLEGGHLIDTLTPETLRQRLAPELELTLWIAEHQRADALKALELQGIDAHANGRGTVVARIPAGDKAQMLQALSANAITVLDFEMEPIQWN